MYCHYNSEMLIAKLCYSAITQTQRRNRAGTEDHRIIGRFLKDLLSSSTKFQSNLPTAIPKCGSTGRGMRFLYHTKIKPLSPTAPELGIIGQLVDLPAIFAEQILQLF